MIALVVALFGAVWLVRVVLIFARPSWFRVLVSIPIVLTGVIFACTTRPTQIDEFVGIVNVSDVLHHGLSVIGMMSAMLWLRTLDPPHRISRLVALLTCSGGLVLIILVVGQWLTAPVHAVESPGDASEWQTFDGAFGIVTVIYHTFIVYGMARIALRCLRDARNKYYGRPEWRVSLTIMGAAILIAASDQALIVVRAAVAQTEYVKLTSVYFSLSYVALFLFAVSLALPSPTLMLHRIVVNWRHLATVSPLWRHLISLFPEAEMQTARIRRPRDLAWTTSRRLIETADCLSRLVLSAAEVAPLASNADPAERLGRCLATRSTVGADGNGKPAASVLPATAGVAAGRDQILVVAEAYRRQLVLRDGTRPGVRLTPCVEHCKFVDSGKVNQ